MFRAKKIALAVAMAAATMSMAQATEVEVFGRFDTGMMYTINSGDSKDNFQMTSGHTTGSRWGIKATEKLNADWTVRAHLESGIESDTGELSSSGRIFGRQMTISLKNPSFGEIAFGRSGKPLSGSDQFTRIRPFTPFGVTYGDAGLLFYGKGGRIDNAVLYQSPKFAGCTVLAAASTQTSNQEEAEWTDNTRFWGGSIDWKGGNVGLMIGAEQTVAKASDKAKGEENPTTLYLGAYYDFGVAKIMAGYQRGWNLDRIGCLRDVEIGSIDTDKTTKNFDANFYLLGATIPAGKGLVRLSAIYMDGENSQELGPNLGKDASYWSLGAGYTYPFSKRTSIYGVVAHLHGEDAIDKDNNASNGDGDLTRYQIAVGLVHKF